MTSWKTFSALVASIALGDRTLHAHDRHGWTARDFDGVRIVVPSETLFGGHGDQDRRDDRPVQRFEIPPGPLADVLEAFTAATGIGVLLPVDSMRAISSPGVSGLFTPERALREILSGTGVAFRFMSPDTVILEFRIADQSVDVVAALPKTAAASPKYTEPLLDTPQTITVVPRSLMDEQSATTLRDVLRNVSGITFQAGEGGTPAGDQMTIRGFSARTDMFIDGIRDMGGYSRDTFNLEQVEVAKGPTSAISGRGSTGASVNLVSKRPTLAESYSGTLEGGNAGDKRTTADLNMPFDPEHGDAVRVNAMWMDGGVAGRDVVQNRSWAVAPSLSLGIAAPTRVLVGYLHMTQHNIPDYGLPWVPANDVPLAAYANGMPPVAQSNFYGLVQRDYEHIENNVATVQVEHDVNGLGTLRNVTQFGSTFRDSVITPPRFASTTSTDIRRTDVKSRDQTDGILANQTTLTGRGRWGGVAHDFVGGLEFARETEVNYARAEVGPDNPTSPNTDLYHPDPNQRYTGAMVLTGAYTDGAARSAAAYAFDTVHMGNWELTGGLRWDLFDVDYNSIASNGIGAPLSRLDTNLSWRAAAVFKPRPNGSVYAGASTSFNPSAEGLALSTSTVNVEPEKSRNYEVGTKWDVLSERLSLTSAVFLTQKTNARTPGVNPGDPPTVLAGKQQVSGVELGVTGSLSRRWSAFANYTFMHSDITASNTPAEVDSALALTPEHTLSAWSTYEVHRGLHMGGGVQYMDAVFRNASNTTIVPPYWLVNSLVAYDVNRHLTLRLNGNNLADTRYVDRMSGGHYIPGPGRSILLSASVKY